MIIIPGRPDTRFREPCKALTINGETLILPLSDHILLGRGGLEELIPAQKILNEMRHEQMLEKVARINREETCWK